MFARTLRAALAVAVAAVSAAYLLRVIYTSAVSGPPAPRRQRGYALKRPLDVGIAAAALVVFAPVMLAAALAIRLTMGGPVLFRQARPGLHGQPFTLLKFRTMSDQRGADGAPLPDADRLTRLGRFLRQTSIDELPQLLNVLRGEMSVVGPRPLLLAYLPLYTPHQARRHDVRPGITGWAQVQGRNGLSWEQKFDLDVDYVERHTLRFDLHILRLTLVKVLRREGISQPGQATAAAFRGEYS
jgi:lipopolysaccharide/colanic/teichoic acid biosynthesis glycosyltransferase